VKFEVILGKFLVLCRQLRLDKAGCYPYIVGSLRLTAVRVHPVSGRKCEAKQPLWLKMDKNN
jgi:hypothetical protein